MKDSKCLPLKDHNNAFPTPAGGDSAVQYNTLYSTICALSTVFLLYFYINAEYGGICCHMLSTFICLRSPN